jgi:hypothetical protein
MLFLELSDTAIMSANNIEDSHHATERPNPEYDTILLFPGISAYADRIIVVESVKKEIPIISGLLRNHSTVWATMMIFGERGDSRKKTFLVVDHFEALLIMLRLAHGLHSQVPTSLAFQTLFNVAILCEKYQAFDLVKVHQIHWLSTMASTLYDGKLEDRLAISQIFKHAPTFAEILSVMIIETGVDTQWHVQRDVGSSFITNSPQPLLGKYLTISSVTLMFSKLPDRVNLR